LTVLLLKHLNMGSVLEEQVDTVNEEWALVAMIFDRGLLITYGVACVAYTVVTFVRLVWHI
ncbi:hypothetical protein LSAT2_026130, partial [Lamellibrachia satsuma]